uniref:Polycomb group ring finger 3 n=1 Tax=Canis lupus dingo TaxID=286419 RepID=A0A8C0LNE0_CANLU
MLTRKIKLWDINAHITCRLCSGYLIDATTVTECLHTFCRSCLVKYLEENNTCPTCRIVIHQSHPLQYIGHDRTMQDIVYKLVPGLQEAEMRKQRDFYHKLGMEVPGDVKGETCSAKQHLDPHRNGETKADDSSNKEAAEEKQEEDNDYHRSDEQLAEKHVLALKHPERKRIEAQTLHTTPQVSICLECNSSKLRGLKRKWIRCSAQATVLHLKKFIAKKLNLSSFNEVGATPPIETITNRFSFVKVVLLKFFGFFCFYIFGDFKSEKKSPFVVHAPCQCGQCDGTWW